MGRSAGTLANHDSIRPDERFLPKHFMTIITHTARDVSDWLTVVKNHGEHLAGFHGFQPKLGLDEIVGTDHAA